MPELPEVEAARRALDGWMRGGRVTAARVHDARIVRGGEMRAGAIPRALAGRTVREVARRGKWLRLAFDDGALVFAHLGMTGKWVRRAPDEPTLPSERARIDLVRRRAKISVRYVDPRLFGRFCVASEDLREWRELGPDPVLDGVDAAALGRALGGRSRRSIKEALLDQGVLAGVGNIYATEALFRARVDPRAVARELSAAEVRAVARGVRDAIAHGLRVTAEDEVTYLHEGRTENPFRIYGRGGTPCPRCHTQLAKIVQAGRGTVFCPACQR